MSKCVFQGAIQHVNANIEETLDSVPVPSHLLLLHHSFGDNLVDCRLDEPGRDPLYRSCRDTRHRVSYSRCSTRVRFGPYGCHRALLIQQTALRTPPLLIHRFRKANRSQPPDRASHSAPLLWRSRIRRAPRDDFFAVTHIAAEPSQRPLAHVLKRLSQWCIMSFGYGSMSHVRQKANISSGRPKETLIYVSMGGKCLPIRMLSFRKCSITSSAG
jgi:hypothetical protein